MAEDGMGMFLLYEAQRSFPFRVADTRATTLKLLRVRQGPIAGEYKCVIFLHAPAQVSFGKF